MMGSIDKFMQYLFEHWFSIWVLVMIPFATIFAVIGATLAIGTLVVMAAPVSFGWKLLVWLWRKAKPSS